MQQTTDITARSWLMILVLGLVWGATFLVIELALDGITPLWLASGRILLASFLLAGIWRFRGKPLFQSTDRDWPRLLIVGALSSALPFALLSWGQQHVTSGFAGVSMAAVALMVLPLAHFMIAGEKMTWRKSIGFAVGFVGVVILIGAEVFNSSGAELETLGRLACLGTAACYALSSVMMRKLPPMDPVALATILVVVGSFMIVPVAFIVEGPPSLPAPKPLMALIILGLIPTAAASLLRVMVIRSAGPTFMSLTNYQVPVWSVVFGSVFLAEPLLSSLLWALALILAGVFLSQWGAMRRLFVR